MNSALPERSRASWGISPAAEIGEIKIRRAQPDDLTSVNAMHRRCALSSRYQRYGAAREEIKLAEWARLTDTARGDTWIATLPDAPHRVVALSHLMSTDQVNVRELAILVEDQWQFRGLGKRLAREALADAAVSGYKTVVCTAQPSNAAVRSMAHRLGAIEESAPGAMSFVITLPTPYCGRSTESKHSSEIWSSQDLCA